MVHPVCAENYTNALAAEEGADAVVDDMEVAATAASVDAYVDAVIEGMARAKAAARKLRNRKRAQRRRRARAAAAAVSDANATASTTASEAATPSAPAEDGDEDGEGVPSLEQIGLVSTGNADADTELATEIHTYGWTMPEGVLYPEAKRDETGMCLMVGGGVSVVLVRTRAHVCGCAHRGLT